MEQNGYSILPATGTDKIVNIAARCSLSFRKSIEIFFVIVTISNTYILMTFFLIYPYQGTSITLHNTPHRLLCCLGSRITGCASLLKTLSLIHHHAMVNIIEIIDSIYYHCYLPLLVCHGFGKQVNCRLKTPWWDFLVN